MPCPACGRPIIANESELYIHHIQPPCEWFCIHANIANDLSDIHTQQESKTLN